jgi:dolichyl-phosphate-mannose-protein mannosyltransferase
VKTQLRPPCSYTLLFGMTRRLTVAAMTMFGLSLALFLFRIGVPAGYVYDEGYYVPAAKALLNGSLDTAPQHPPFGKIMIAGGIKLFGPGPLGWRFASAVCGSLTLVAIFLWTYLLLGDLNHALLAATLTLFNNFLYVMARVAMLDVLYFCLVMLGVLAFTASVMWKVSLGTRRILLGAAGMLLGLATACKWNGLVFLGCIVLVCGYLLFYARDKMRELGLPLIAISLLLLPLLAYYLAFVAMATATHSSASLQAFLSANRFIWHWHRMAPGNPTLNVRWYRWFFRSSPERGLSYLMGNFVVVWTGVVALVLCLWRLCKNRAGSIAELMVILLYAANVLQWLVIPQKSTCYYYYYPSAMLLGVAIAIALARSQVRAIKGIRISVVLVVASVVFFLYCYPRMAALQAPYDCALGCWV